MVHTSQLVLRELNDAVVYVSMKQKTPTTTAEMAADAVQTFNGKREISGGNKKFGRRFSRRLRNDGGGLVTTKGSVVVQ